jgi:hypothetical protein
MLRISSQTTTVLDNLTLQEQIPMERIDRLLNSKYLQTIKIDERNVAVKAHFPDNLSLVHSYSMLSENNLVDVTYNLSPTKPWGRVYPQGSLSIGLFERHLRHYLAHESYVDIDCVNAHPTIIHAICVQKGWNFPTLKKYVENKKQVRVDVCTYYGITDAMAKTLLLRLMFGGSTEAFQKEFLIDKEPMKMLIKLEDELDSIRTKVLSIERQWFDLFKIASKEESKKPRRGPKPAEQDEDEEDEEITKKDKKAASNYTAMKRSAFSYLIQDMERRILEILVLSLKSQFVLTDNIYTLCYDGIMLRKQEKPFDPEILREAERSIKELTGIPMKLEMKDMTEYGLLVEKILDAEYKPVLPPPDLNYFSEEYFSSLYLYKDQFKYFNKFHVYNKSDESYVYRYKLRASDDTLHKIHRDTSKSSHTLKGMLTIYGHLKSTMIRQIINPVTCLPVGSKQVRTSFISEWLNHCPMVDRALNKPVNLTESEMNAKFDDISDGFLNTFLGYSDSCRKHPKLSDGSPDLERIHEVLKLYLDVALHICEGSPALLEQLLIIFGHKLKFPEVRNEVCPLLLGAGGCGKNSILVVLSYLINPRAYAEIEDLQDLFGPHSMLVVDKLIVCMNEMQCKESIREESKLKGFKTKSHVVINEKCKRQRDEVNNVLLVSTSNKMNAVVLESTGYRRWMALLATEEYKGRSKAFWDEFHRQCCTEEFIGALYYYLTQIIDTDKVDKELYLNTQGVAMLSKSNRTQVQMFFDEYVHELYNDGDYYHSIPHKELYNHFKEFCSSGQAEDKSILNLSGFNKAITQMDCQGLTDDYNKDRLKCYKFNLHIFVEDAMTKLTLNSFFRGDYPGLSCNDRLPVKKGERIFKSFMNPAPVQEPIVEVEAEADPWFDAHSTCPFSCKKLALRYLDNKDLVNYSKYIKISVSLDRCRKVTCICANVTAEERKAQQYRKGPIPL